jgi:mevalonate kinase
VIKLIPETKFYIPGKTFLVGEYAVLLGGSALGIASAPFFELELNNNLSSDFHPDSPAGKYLNKNNLKNSVAFTDQYQARGVQGGFGRSTAEFLAAMLPNLIANKISAFEILKLYRDLHSGEKIRPSGIDLVFQLLGNVTWVDQQLNLFQNFEWNFLNLDYFIISSGLKVQTHDHLQSLNLDSLKDLPPLSNEICKLFSENNENEFVYQLKTWCEFLEAKKLTHVNSLEIKKGLENSDLIKLVKPCGALGADVLIVFFDRSQKNEVRKLLDNSKLKVVSSSADLAAGLISQLRPYWSKNVG